MNKHEFIKTGDFDAHPALCDRNGEVVLQHCRKCDEGEGTLAAECPVTIVADPKPFTTVVLEWSRRRTKQPDLRLGQYFISRYAAPGYKNYTLFYATGAHAFARLEALYHHYGWPRT